MEGTLYKTDKNGTKYYHNNGICPACGGSGYLPQYSYNEGGICFNCNGTGRKIQKWKVYTPEYEAKLKAKKLEKRKSVAQENNSIFLNKNNFNKDGYTFIVLGNTYEIRDQLKSQGAKYSRELGWHFSEEKENTVKVHIDQVCDKDDAGQYFFKYEADDIVKDLTRNQTIDSSKSEHVYREGDTVNISVIYKGIKSFESHYSYHGELNYIYNFEDEQGNKLFWKTSKEENLEEGKTYNISCKIKSNTIYNNEKQTAIKNVKISGGN